MVAALMHPHWGPPFHIHPQGLDMVESQTWSLAFLLCPAQVITQPGVDRLKLNLCRVQSGHCCCQPLACHCSFFIAPV